MKKTIKRTICMILTVAMLCADTGVTAYAAEGVEQEILADAMVETSAEEVQVEEDLAEEVETGEASTEDAAPENNTDVEDGENIDDVSAEEEILLEEENDREDVADLETVPETSGDDIIASGEYKENGNDITWVIDADGKLTVEGTGDFASNSYVSRTPWYKNCSEIKTAVINVTGMKNASYMFIDCSNLTSVDVSGFDTSSVTSMRCMFWSCRDLTNIDVSGFDTGSVADMASMFEACSSLTSLDMSGFNTGNVIDMSNMFYGCSSLTSVDVSGFDTEKVEDMGGMFSGCSSLTSMDMSGFDTGNVEDMGIMFSDCSSLMSVDVSGFDTRKVTDMGRMFHGCSSLTSVDVSGFDTGNVTIMGGMFSGCSSLTSVDVSGFDTGKVTNMSYMFWECRSLTSVDVSGFDTGKVTDMGVMFYGCNSLTSVDVRGFDTGNVTNMEGVFANCRNLTSLDVSGFDTGNVINMRGMFRYCSSLTSLDLSSFDTSSATNIDDLFTDCNKLLIIYTPYNLKLSVALPAESTDIWYQPDGTQINELPQKLDHSILIKRNEVPIRSTIKATKTKTAYVCGDTINLDDLTVTYYNADGIAKELGNDDYTTNADEIDMSTEGAKPLVITYGEMKTTVELTVTGKEGGGDSDIIASGEYKENGNDITWVIDADGKLMVEGTGDFATSVVDSDRAPWFKHRMSIKSAEVNVTGMSDASNMFRDCSNLTSLDMSGFDTSKVTDMGGMFSCCSSLANLNVSNFDTSNVTDMKDMFWKCSSLTSLDVSGFDTGKAANIELMFHDCSSLTSLDLSSFDLSNIVSAGKMILGCSNLTIIKTPKNVALEIELPVNTGYSWYYNESEITSLPQNLSYSVEIKRSNSITFDDNIAGGTYENITWVIDADGKLTVEGTGDFTDSVMGRAPWYNQRMAIRSAEVNVTGMSNASNMFYCCSNLVSLDVSGFDTSSITNMHSMFDNCDSLTNLDVSGFNTGKVTDMSSMFNGCSRLTSLDVSNFDTSNVAGMRGMFWNCSSLTSLEVSGFDTSKVTDMGFMFTGCSSLTSLDLGSFDTSKVTDISSMFSYCSSLTSLDLNNFDTSNVTDMGLMFWGCSNLTNMNLSSFDTSKLTDMESMFFNCSALTSLDLSSFDTSKVTCMGYMFNGCRSLRSLDVSGFDTSKVTQMSGMFEDCSSLTSVDLSSFDTSKVTERSGVFNGCTSLTTIHTPYNLKCQVPLPKSETTDIWYDYAGNEYAELPQNLDHSILLTKNTVPAPESIFLSADNVTITLPDTYNYVYDGNAKTPEVTVVYTVSGNIVGGNSVSGNSVNKNSVTLEKETDYTVTYENNINAFENVTDTDTSENAPKVIIIGQNMYSGTVSKAFSIQKAAILETEEQTVYIKNSGAAHEGYTLDLSGCFTDYNDKTGYTVGIPIENDAIAGSVLSGKPSIDENGILAYNTDAGTSGDFVVIPVAVSFSNHKDAVINVKIIMEKESVDGQIESVAVPTANPESGRQLTAGSEVTLVCETAGTEIYYTISNNEKDLTDPTEDSVKYTTPIIISTDVYIRAVAIKGSNSSKFINLHYTVAVAEDNKVLKPYAAPGQGAVDKGTKVELKCDTPDAVIYYAVGGNADILGSVPIDDDHKYTESIEITKDIAIKAIAKKDGMKDSDFSTFVYRINVTLDAPVAEPASGTVDQGSYISLKSDSDVNIYYTMDQTDPVTSGSAKLYESRIRVEGNAGSVIVIKAAAEKKGIYSKPVTFTYMISESTVKGLQVTLAGSEEYIYTGSAITPAVIVTNNGEELIEGEDYTIRYSNNVKAADKSAGKAPKITVSGKGNLTKSKSITFTIKPKYIGDEEEVVGDNIVVVSGKTATPILFYDGVKLTAKDFDNPNTKKKYTENETITITGKGNFEGERDIDVRVVSKDDMKKFTVAIDNKALKREPLIYDGEEKTLDGYFEVYDAADKSSPLEEYSDYAVIYPKNNINAGKVKFTVVGLGEYYGTVTKAYTINPRVIKTGEDGAIDVSVNNGDEYPFRSGGVTISDLTVSCDGEVLALGRDYKVTYSNNKKICTNNNAKCKISFIGNYKGSKAIVRKFNITATMMDDVDKINESVSVAVADMVYTGKPGAYKSIPYVTVNGALMKSSDYNVSYYKDVDRSQVIDGKTPSTSLDLTDSDKQTVYMKIEGKGNYNGTLTAEYNVYKLNEGAIDLSKAKVTIVGGNRVEYTGEGVGPNIEIKYKSDNGWETVDADDIGTYVTVTYINNVNKGKATVMINGNGDRYVGSKTAIFNIVPKSMK